MTQKKMFFTPLHRRAEFRAAWLYLQMQLPELPRYQAAYHYTRDGVPVPLEELEMLFGDANSPPAATKAEASMAQVVIPRLVAETLLTWMVTSAEVAAGVDLADLGRRAGGLYVFELPAEAVVNTANLRPVLQYKLQRRSDPLTEQESSPPALIKMDLLDVPADQGFGNPDASVSGTLSKAKTLIAEGYHVFLSLRPGQRIPPSLSAFVLHRFKLPTLDRTALRGVHAICTSGRGILQLEDITAALLQGDVSIDQWALALCCNDRLPLATTIQNLITSATTSTSSQNAAQRDVTLDTIVGHPAAVALGRQIVTDSEAWRQGALDWDDVPNGLLLDGPPGNGKTMFVQGLANSCKGAVFAASYADCLMAAQGTGSTRQILDQVYNVGRQAADHAARGHIAVVFVDELDGFGQSRFGQADHNSSYFRMLTTGLLPFFEQIRRSPGILLVAATNDVKAVDPALIRPGRFDHHLHLHRPTLDDIAALLAESFPALLPTDLHHAAQQLVGSSFAAVASVIRRARASARSEGADVDYRHLEHSVVHEVPATLNVSADDLLRCAVHEAGHAVMIYLLTGQAPVEISLTIDGGGEALHHAPPFYTTARLYDALKILLAGRVAEAMVFRDISSGSGESAQSDLARATYLTASAYMNWHLQPEADLLWQQVPARMNVEFTEQQRSKISNLLRAQEKAAHSHLVAHKQALVQLAHVLLERREMRQGDIEQVLQGFADLAQAASHQLSGGSLGK